MLDRPQSATDEENLAERFRRGDEAAFERIVCDNRRAVYLMARRVLRRHDEAGAESLDQVPDGSEGTEERLRRRQLRQRLRGAVERLPQRQKEAVLLKVFSELTYREAAEVMDLSEGAVKAHIHQAVSNLRRLMRDGGSVRIPGEVTR